jgi:hypothetical protein
VIDTRDVSWVCEYADVLQIGARNMQNFSLLREVGKANKPVLLKRGMHSTIEEWMKRIHAFLAEHETEAYCLEELADHFDFREVEAGRWSVELKRTVENPKLGEANAFGLALEKLEETGNLEARFVDRVKYYRATKKVLRI